MNKATISEIVLGNSQKKFFSCFVELRKERPTEKISVTELCQKAEINRSTFYRNYYDIFDLEEKLEEYCINSILSFCASFDFGFDESIRDEEEILKIPKFDNGLVIEAVRVLRHEKNFLQKIYDKLLFFFPMGVPEGFSERKAEELKNVFSFIVTGALHLCSEAPRDSIAEDVYTISTISYYLFNHFATLAESDEEFEDLPLSEKESGNVETKRERLNVLKTKRNLKRAFAALLRKKSVEKITVSELCEEAEICNSTFYTHFSSIDDFILKMKNKIMNEFLLIAKSIYSQMGEDMLKVKDLLAYIDKNRKLFLSISSNDGFCQTLFRCPKEFADSFFDLIQKDYESIFDNKIAFEFICYCAWGALFSPFEDAEPSTSKIFRLSYVIFLILFKKKEKNEQNEA